MEALAARREGPGGVLECYWDVGVREANLGYRETDGEAGEVWESERVEVERVVLKRMRGWLISMSWWGLKHLGRRIYQC